MTYDELVALPPDELASALAGLTGPQRAALADGLSGRLWQLTVAERWTHVWLLALGCLGGPRQVARAVRVARLPNDAEPLAVRVLRDRRPSWLADLPTALGTERWVEGWRLVRALVREGLVAEPADDWYALGLAGSINGWGPERLTIVEALRADPGLLDRDVWTLLRTEGAGQELTRADAYTGRLQPGDTWRDALVTLAGDGTLDRGRLLDAALGALLRDWAPVQLPWFVALHDALAPEVAEQVARQGTYARLLTVAYGPAVRLGQRALGRVLAAGALDVDGLLAATPAVLLRPDKGSALAHLRLLAAVAAAHPERAGDVRAAALVAAEHGHADVRERAAAFAGAGPAAGAGASSAAGAGIGPAAGAGIGPAAGAAPGRAPVAGAAAGRARPAPDPVEPVAGAGELVELLTRLLEDAGDPVAVERALEGVARLAGERPPRGTGPLAKRAARWLDAMGAVPWSGAEPRANVAALAHGWLTGDPPARPPIGRLDSDARLTPDRTLGALAADRAYEVAVAVHAGGARLLALPATSDGALPADVLNARLAGVDPAAEPLPADVAVAALRVPPGDYDAVRAPAGHRTGDAVRAALAALAAYDPDWERLAVTAEPSWRESWPAVTWRDRRPPPARGPLAVALDRERAAEDFPAGVRSGEHAKRYEHAVALWPLLLPHHPDLLAAHAHARLARGLGTGRSAAGPLLDGLARTTRPAGPVACSALVLGLMQADGGDRARAADAVADLAPAGLVAGAGLGGQAAAALGDGVGAVRRLAATLSDTARIGPAAAAVALDALVALLPALPGRRDAHLLVDVLAEVAVANGRTVALPEELAALARGRSSSALAAACRRVPG